jgi:predicted metal-binding protein
LETEITDILTQAEAATGIHVHEWALLSTDKLIFSPQLLEYCKSNVCGNYNKSWTCPPACESIEKQREKILSYESVFVFTTKHDLEDSFDYEGMTQGMKLHSLLTIEFKKRSGGAPVYGAGSCPVCRDSDGKASCVFPIPCPFPENRIGSIEAAGINVTELSKAAGIAYNNGPNTVTYFSMALLNRR